MDTKSKNNRRIRSIAAVICVILISAGTVLFFPGISEKADRQLAIWSEEQENQQVNAEVLSEIYDGTYVLFYEMAQRKEPLSAADLYFEPQYDPDTLAMGTVGLINDLKNEMNSRMADSINEFDEYRLDIDYCVITEDGKYEKNTGQPLEAVVENPNSGKAVVENSDSAEIELLREYYNNYFVMQYDANGILTVGSVYSRNLDAGMIIKMLGQYDRDDSFWRGIRETYGYLEGGNNLVCGWKKPSDFTVIFGIPETAANQLVYADGDYEYGMDYYMTQSAYAEAGGSILFLAALALVAALVFLMTSSRIWRCGIPMKRPGNWYLMEAAIFGAIEVISESDDFMQIMWSHKAFRSYDTLYAELFYNNPMAAAWQLISALVSVGFLLAVWYVSIRFLRPAVTLGLREYVRQYSLIYQIFPLVKQRWEEFAEEIRHIDFSEKSTKVILKIVILNYIVLAVISMFWFFGLAVLLVYSVALFYLIKKYYDRAGRDYQRLLRGVGQIAEGNLDAGIDEDIGVFEPFKEQLSRIRFGFKKAVDDEVKSQRMKTELITNVSHDLKTPLTAITTYVELLKKEDITEEERRSYIETLERKSLRLKVLIEDLFEVSKATSNNITLDLMQVDVVKLMKQVSVEHADQFAAASLELRWNVPEESVILMLDNQKTYRIFENLFVNIQKYAMPGSRVYVEVRRIPGAQGGGGTAAGPGGAYTAGFAGQSAGGTAAGLGGAYTAQNDPGSVSGTGMTGMSGAAAGAMNAAGTAEAGSMPGAAQRAQNAGSMPGAGGIPGGMSAPGMSGSMPGASGMPGAGGVPGGMTGTGMSGATGTSADLVEITLKNMSAAELTFRPDEITERFVRGDESRNTEGSGLGLAIAKSFTEAQNGSLHVEVDGDLFKVVIRWKCVIY